MVSAPRMERVQVERIKKARILMRKLDLDAIVGTAWDNLRYLTDSEPFLMMGSYLDTGAAILPIDGEPVIAGGVDGSIGNGVRVIQEFRNVPYAAPANIPQTWAKVFTGAFKELGLTRGRVGFDYLPDSILRELTKTLGGIEFAPIVSDLLQHRAVKTPEEVKLLKKAATIVDAGMQRGLDAAKEDVTEKELFIEISNAMYSAGSEMLPWNPALSSGGEHSDFKPTDRRLRKGDSVRWDVGAIFRGYVGDASRTAFVGTPTREFKKLYSDVYDAYMSGVRAIRPGNKASDVDFSVRSSLAREKYPIYNVSLGHGLGLTTQELPWIAPRQDSRELDMTLEQGMVISLEPETYSGRLFTRLEDMILVTEHGNELLTKAPYLFS